MTAGREKVRFESLTYEEVARRAAGGSLAIVPTGCTEQQGPHLPVGFDTRFADALCVAAAERARAAHGVDCLVLPALPFGPTPEHRAYGAGVAGTDLHHLASDAGQQLITQRTHPFGFHAGGDALVHPREPWAAPVRRLSIHRWKHEEANPAEQGGCLIAG